MSVIGSPYSYTGIGLPYTPTPGAGGQPGFNGPGTGGIPQLGGNPGISGSVYSPPTSPTAMADYNAGGIAFANQPAPAGQAAAAAANGGQDPFGVLNPGPAAKPAAAANPADRGVIPASTYRQMQNYNANADQGGFQYYDPTGGALGMGYGGSYTYPTLGGGQQSPQQLAAIADMYGADAARQAALGVASTQAGASNFASGNTLAGVQDTNKAGITTTGMNNATNLGLGNLNLQGVLGAANASKEGQIGAANAAAGGQVGAANAAADASKFGSTAGLQGVQNTNAANQNIATTQAGAQTGVAGINANSANYLGQLGLQGALGTAGLNLQGVQNTNAANQAIAGTQAGAQENVANTQAGASNYAANAGLQGQLGVAGDQLQGSLANTNASIQNTAGTNAANVQQAQITTDPALLKAQGLLQALGLGSGTGTGTAGGSGAGILGGLTGAGLGLGSVGGGSPVMTGSLGTTAAGSGNSNTVNGGQPSVPNPTNIDSQLLLKNFNQGQAGIKQQLATEANKLAQSRGGGAGFNTTSSAGGLPIGIQQQLQQQGLQANAQNALNAENFANTANNKNNLDYANLGLGQYNQSQERLLQLLGLQLNNQGQLLGALS